MSWRSKVKPAAGGKSFDKRARAHAGLLNKLDLMERALKSAISKGLKGIESEVVPGLARSNWLPTVDGGVYGTDKQLDAILKSVSTKLARTYEFERKDRHSKKDGGKPVKRHTPKNANESFHANYPPHVLIAARWARQMGLPSPAQAFDANQQFCAELVERKFGVKVVAVCRHTPNPFTDKSPDDLKALRAAGWVIDSEPTTENAQQKEGAWNIHEQYYITRVWQNRYTCNHRDFRYANTRGCRRRVL